MEEEKTIEENTKRTTRKEENEKNRKRTKKIIIIIGICIIVLLCMSTVFAVLNMTNEKVINGVYISDINVSNLTKKELEQKLQEITEEMSARKIVLKYQELETAINLNDIDLQYNLDEITNQAYNIGRDSNIFVNNFAIIKSTLLKTKLNMDIKYNEELIDKKIEEMGAILPGAVEEYAYYIEGEELVITKGKPGLSIEKEKLKKQIREAIYKIGKNEEIINVPVKQKEPDKIDMEKIHDEIYKEPVDAYITQNPTTVHPNVNGVNFAISVEEATKLLEEDKEEYRVPLKITVANKTIRDLGEEAFPDVLGTFTTRYDATNKNRSNNISLAAQKINGTVILPGETFSYNKTVGKRTKAAGFKEAGAYAGGKVIQEVGGGICQVSSTLYNAVVYANLEITERSNHCFESSYVAAGRDATVSWGTLDFKFKNNRQYPVKIEASANSGVNKITIKGIKEDKEYEVVIQSKVTSIIQMPVQYQENSDMNEGEERIIQYGHNGCTSVTYKILKLNGATISTELMSTDYYKPLERIIEKGTKKVLPQEPEEKPSQPEQPTPSPSENTEKPTSGEEGGE